MKTRRLSAEQLRTLAARMVAAKTDREKETLQRRIIDGFYGKKMPKTRPVKLDDVDSIAGRKRMRAVLDAQPFPHYERGPKPGLLVRVEADGSRAVGRFIGRKWISESEEWLFRNPSALASVRKGLKEAGQGKVSSRGSELLPRYIIPVRERRNGELYIQIPRSVLRCLGWKSGNEIRWRKKRGENAYVVSAHPSSGPMREPTSRGKLAKPLIAAASGPALSTSSVTERLKLSTKTVRGMIERGQLIAFRSPTDETKILLPRWQFTARGKIQPWVSELITAYGDNSWALMNFLVAKRTNLNGASYLDALHRGNASGVIAMAKRTNVD